MKTLGLILAFLLANGPALAEQTPRGAEGLVCDQKAFYDASTSGTTELVPLETGRSIFVCSYSFFVGATATNVSLVSGTGTACGTGQQSITPAYNFIANQGISDPGPFGNALQTYSGRALCIKASAGNPVQALVKYTIK